MQRGRMVRVAAPAMLSLLGTLAFAQVAVPPLTGHVVDLTGTLSAAAATRMDSELTQFEAQKGSQIAVLIVPTTQPEEIEQFSIRVAEKWKIGRKNVDDGAILVVAKNDRRVRIEVGAGLEGALPDASANRIIDEGITPRFKLGDFDGGVQAGVDLMVKVVGGEPLPPPPDHQWKGNRPGGFMQLLPFLLIGIFVVSGVLRSVLGPLFGSIATGGVVGVVTFLLSQLLVAGIGAAVVAFLFALLRGSIPGGGFGGMGGFGGLGGGGFGGGGGLGGGGFSGGGGSFSGGGASGSW